MKYRTLAGLLIVGMLVPVTGCPSREEAAARVAGDARQRGRAGAEADIAAGMLKQKEYPALPYSKQQIDYLRLLQSECGVTNEVVSGPDNSQEMRTEVAAYNEVMAGEIRKRFGADIFQKLREKADAK